MSFAILFWDELRGFVKSKIMFALWIGMPLLAILMHFIQPDTEGMPISVLTGVLISAMGGALAAVLLSTSIVNESNAKVYDLYLIRPVKRHNILLAKYFAVILNLVIATFLSLAIGLLIDRFTIGLPPEEVLMDTLDSLVMAIAAMSIASAIGILIGILVKSVGLAAILSLYLGQQLSLLIMLPGIFFEKIPLMLFSAAVGIPLTIVVIFVEIFIFSKKQF